MNKKLRICHIGWASSPHTARWVKWLAKRGHDSFLITDQGEIEGVKTYVIPHSFGEDKRPRWKRYMQLSINDFRIQRIRWISNLVKEINPDILHSHALWYPGNLGVFLRVKNFVVTVMNGDILYHHGKDASLAHHLFVMFAMKKAKLITGVSQTLINAAQIHGANKKKTYVVRRGVDFSLFNANRDKQEIRKKLGLKSQYIVLSPRYLALKANISTLIHAVPYVLKKIRDVQFVFIYPSGGDELTKLKMLAEDLMVSEKLLFIGTIPHEQVPLYHTAADVMVSIPLADSGPVALQEAMACGAVPILSDLPCVREWIEHDVNGMLVKAKDKEKLAEYIIDLLVNDEKRKKFSEINKKLIEERGETNKIMEEVERLYYYILKNDRK